MGLMLIIRLDLHMSRVDICRSRVDIHRSKVNVRSTMVPRDMMCDDI